MWWEKLIYCTIESCKNIYRDQIKWKKITILIVRLFIHSLLRKIKTIFETIDFMSACFRIKKKKNQICFDVDTVVELFVFSFHWKAFKHCTIYSSWSLIVSIFIFLLITFPLKIHSNKQCIGSAHQIKQNIKIEQQSEIPMFTVCNYRKFVFFFSQLFSSSTFCYHFSSKFFSCIATFLFLIRRFI